VFKRHDDESKSDKVRGKWRTHIKRA
jgi:hypothetical protein